MNKSNPTFEYEKCWLQELKHLINHTFLACLHCKANVLYHFLSTAYLS